MLRLARPVFLLLLTACATSGTSRVSPTEVPGIQGRDCRYLPLRVDDEASGWGAVLGDEVSEPVTLSIRYGPEGELAWVREVGFALTPEGSALAARIEAVVEPSSEPDWGYRIRFAPGQPPEPLPGIHCEAALPDGVRFLDPSRLAPLTPSMLPRSEGPFRMSVVVRVGPDGSPRDPRVRVHSEITHFHSPLRESAMSHRYLPALHDGFPVDGTFEFQSEVGVRITRR